MNVNTFKLKKVSRTYKERKNNPSRENMLQKWVLQKVISSFVAASNRQVVMFCIYRTVSPIIQWLKTNCGQILLTCNGSYFCAAALHCWLKTSTNTSANRTAALPDKFFHYNKHRLLSLYIVNPTCTESGLWKYSVHTSTAENACQQKALFTPVFHSSF